jgi:hypothetical protein
LGLASEFDYTPRVRHKVVFAAVQCASFAQAERMLAELAALNLPAKRIWRAAQRAGEERVAQRAEATRRYAALPLPAQQQSPRDAEPPEVACVSMDGGRYQRRARQPAAGGEHATCWREMKVGCLTSMTSDRAAEDPCPQLPATFADPARMEQIAREIKGFSTTEDEEAETPADLDDEAGAARDERPGRPLVVQRSVVATAGDVTAFGPLLAAAAYERGLHAAPRKAFVADGSETNWSVWRNYFSHYTPIVDFVHALMYVYAAAMAGDAPARGWQRYRQWAQQLWSGAIEELLAALADRQQELGAPADDEAGTPRAQLAQSLRYLRNQSGRMQYDHYRRQGLPLTSTLVESTIKQLNRRVKGTEKFWDAGIEPLLTLAADHLCDRPPPAAAPYPPTHSTLPRQAA